MRTEDGYIIHKCLNGEPEAFGFLVDKYKASIYAFAYTKVSDFRDAEDVTQEVFVKAYQKLRTLRRWDSVLAWLYAITSNQCKNLIRSRNNRPDGEFIKDQESVDMAKPYMYSYHENLAFESIREALDLLPEKYSQVLTLHYFGGMTCKEIANFLRTSPAAIRKRLSRARSQLKAEVLAMMSTAYGQQKLGVNFTFRIVEIVKRIKIHPVSPVHQLPWGLSLATGIIFTVLGLYPQLFPSINPVVTPAGEIPVYLLKTQEIPFLANQQRNIGEDANTPHSENAIFLAPQTEGGIWAKKADMLVGRHGLSTCVVNGRIYTVGGSPDDGNAIAAAEEYDPVTDKWTKKADMPEERQALSACVANGKIYAIGGYGDYLDSSSAVVEYDPVTGRWTKKADMPTARVYLSTSAVGGKIYAIGGVAFRRDKETIYFAAVEEYDPAADIWTKKADMPTPRGGLSTCVVNGKIYAMGGSHQRHGLNDYTALATVEEYDPATDTWTKKADMLTARYVFAASVVNGRIYTIGGRDRTTDFSIVEEYDPATDTWSRKTDMPTERCSASASVVDGRIYVFGGVDWPHIFSTVEEYTPE